MSKHRALHMGIVILMLSIVVGCDDKPSFSANNPERLDIPPLPTEGQILAGKALHEANCISCHDSTVYTRNDRVVADFPALVAQVRRCDANLSTRLFDEEIQQVALYLNQAYYQFRP